MAIIVVIAVIFIAGAVAGALALICCGIRREERDFTLTRRRAPGQLTQGTRRITGLWVRQPTDNSSWATREKLLV